MQFDWDPSKASANLRKHRVAFSEAMAVFFDPLARIFPDLDHSQAEEREIIIGYDATARLLIVSFVERSDKVRIISARRATAHETKAHEDYIA
jgi:uncharacterized DUF497 family protein